MKNVLKTALCAAMILTAVNVACPAARAGVELGRKGEEAGSIASLSIGKARRVQFNCLAGDREFLTGTLDESVMPHDPVMGQNGKVITVSQYYHNATVGVMADNTRVWASFSPFPRYVHTVVGALKASNSDTVRGTIQGGREVGKPNLVITTPGLTMLEFVRGSVKWVPERGENGPSSPLPYGQTGDEILTGAGLRLGAIGGGWQYSGHVTYQLRVVAFTQKVAFNDGPGDITTLLFSPLDRPDLASDEVEVDQGGEIDFYVWVHQTRPDALAYDVRIKVFVPVGETDGPQQVIGRISAINAVSPAIGKAWVTGGESNSGLATIEYVRGSLELYTLVDGMFQLSDFPQGMNPDDIVEANGLRLATYPGGWQHAALLKGRLRVRR